MDATSSDAATPYAQAQADRTATLRRMLLDAAGRLLLSEGPQALTMRRIAGKVGCSATVLYTLFGDKQGLANALYLEGFERLRLRLEAVERGDDPLQYLGALGRAYRANALENAPYYAVMFERSIPEFAPPPESRAEARRSLEVMVSAVTSCIEAGVYRREDPWQIAEVLWAAVHGAVSLELAGHFPDAEVAQQRFTELTSAAGAWFRTRLVANS